MNATAETREHYFRPDVKDTILNLAREGQYVRWGNGDDFGWYKYEGTHKFPLNLIQDYDRIVEVHRILYWSLNFFDSQIFNLDYNHVSKEESPLKSRHFTRAYTIGVDIDTIDKVNGHGSNIKDPKVKAAVESMAQYFCNRLKEHAPNSVHVLFSGGGIYVFLHHKALDPYFSKYQTDANWASKVELLTKTINSYLSSIGQDFANEYPEHARYAKSDIINNSKRLFKSIFSIHKKHPFACVPLDPNNIVISFDNAHIPLHTNVVKESLAWYQSFDSNMNFLNSLKPFKKIVENEISSQYYQNKCDAYIGVSEIPITFEDWPPCIKNIFEMQSCGEGKTRALALIAAFLGQVGIPEREAKNIFYGLASRWGAATTNIFDSYYQKMQVPSCTKLRSNLNIGFPSGCSIRKLNVCKPDQRCISILSPRYYADRQANVRRINRQLIDPKSNP